MHPPSLSISQLSYQYKMKTAALQSFAFADRSVRIILINDQPWFVALDVCRVLDIRNHRDAIARLDDDEKGVALTDTLGGKQNISIINESGLYTIMLRCDDAIKPGTRAHAFRKWVTNEVLPQIRRTGSYQSQMPLPGSAKEREVTAILLEAARRLQLDGDILKRIMPVLSDYGRPGARGKLKTGLRRAAFVASPQRSRDAAAVLTFSLQLELPLPGRA